MPNNIIQSLHKKTGLSIQELESKWESAKKYVKNELGFSEDDKRFYPSVVGTMKHWLRNSLKESCDELFEMTETGDVAKYDQKMNLLKRREPDGKAHDGNPYFIIDDDHIISKILDGKKKHERWQNIINDKGIHQWANKNFLKSFHVKTPNGPLIKVR